MAMRPKRPARHRARLLAAVEPERIPERVVLVGVAVRPAVDGDGQDVARRIEPAAAQHPRHLVADASARSVSNDVREQLGASGAVLVAGGQARRARRAASCGRTIGSSGDRRAGVVADVHGEVEVASRRGTARARNAGDAELARTRSSCGRRRSCRRAAPSPRSARASCCAVGSSGQRCGITCVPAGQDAAVRAARCRAARRARRSPRPRAPPRRRRRARTRTTVLFSRMRTGEPGLVEPRVVDPRGDDVVGGRARAPPPGISRRTSSRAIDGVAVGEVEEVALGVRRSRHGVAVHARCRRRARGPGPRSRAGRAPRRPAPARRRCRRRTGRACASGRSASDRRVELRHLGQEVGVAHARQAGLLLRRATARAGSRVLGVAAAARSRLARPDSGACGEALRIGAWRSPRAAATTSSIGAEGLLVEEDARAEAQRP